MRATTMFLVLPTGTLQFPRASATPDDDELLATVPDIAQFLRGRSAG